MRAFTRSLLLSLSLTRSLFFSCSDEIDFLLLCCDTNHEGKIDYGEFTSRFLDPSKEIGFNLAILLTNLSEHMPSDPRLAKFLESAGTVLNFFEPYLGRIEVIIQLFSE